MSQNAIAIFRPVGMTWDVRTCTETQKLGPPFARTEVVRA
jgi:hypothetical protein